MVEIPKKERTNKAYDDEVWGLVYSLEQDDEDNLDINEGVPIAYTKEDLVVNYWPTSDSGAPNVTAKAQEKQMLVYINRNLTTPSKPKKEYVYRMNMGIKDAVKEGMPKEYVEKVMRRYIPDVEDEEAREVAQKQALLFEDER